MTSLGIGSSAAVPGCGAGCTTKPAESAGGGSSKPEPAPGAGPNCTGAGEVVISVLSVWATGLLQGVQSTHT